MCNHKVVYPVPKHMSCHKAIVVITGGHIVFMIAYLLLPSCFC